MIVFTQFSYTSVKKFLMASSVCGLVGFAAMDVEERDEVVDAAVAVVGFVGWCRSRNLMLPPVMKQDI
jgi:hypothetical protein